MRKNPCAAIARSSRIDTTGLLALVLVVTGCAPVQTAKQQPATDFVADCTARAMAAMADNEAALQPVAPAAPDPTIYRTDSVAHDVAEARCYARDLAWHYARKERHARDETKWHFDVPLIATAIAGAGALLYRANIDVVSGIGLVAGGLTASKSYFHPDTNQTAYLTAGRQLMCIYDKTHILAFVNRTDTLYNDRRALRAALQELVEKAGPLLNLDDNSGTASEKAIAKAAKASRDAGDKALLAIRSALSDYAQMPTTIYQYADQIDVAGRTASLTTMSYSAIYATIRDSIDTTLENKTTVKEARDALLKAQTSAPAAAATQAVAKGDKKATDDKAKAAADVTTPQAAVTPQLYSSCATSKNLKCTGATEDQASAGEIRSFNELVDPKTDAITKLNRVVTIALDDLPAPAFSDVRADIASCVQP